MEYLECLELVNVVGGLDKNISEDLRVHHSRLTSIKVAVAELHGLLLFTHLSCPNIQSIIVQGDVKVEPKFLAPIASAFYGMVPMPSIGWKARGCSIPSLFESRAAVYTWPDSSQDTDAPFQISVYGPLNFQTDLALSSLLPATVPYILESKHLRYFLGGDDLDYEALYEFLRSLEGVRELHCSSNADVVTILSDTPLTENNCL